MASAKRPLVNQRLYYARLHRDWLQEKLDEQQHPKAIVEQALGESLVMHLVMAYRVYLQEVAEAYQLDTDAERAQQLSEQMTIQGISSAECEELCALESGQEWLARLLKLYKGIGEAEEPVKNHPSASAIQLQVVDSQTFNAPELLQLYHNLQALIDKQRGCLEEW